MQTEKFKNDVIYRRFLLGEMTDDEREEFEREFLANENIFDELRVTEDELVENYACGMLEALTKQKFEEQYLRSEKARQKLALTRAMLENFNQPKTSAETKKKVATEAEPSVLKSLAAFFTLPKTAFGAAAVLLLLIAALFFLRTPKNDEIVKIAPPAPTASVEPNVRINQNKPVEIPLNNSNISNAERVNSNSVPNPAPKPKETPQPEKIVPNPVLALFAGTVRADGKTNTVTIPKDAKGVNLLLNLESQDYKNYRAEIVDQNGKTVFKSGNIRSRNSKINAFVPSAKLAKGDYLVKVYGLTAENTEESAADFQFRVNR